MQGKARQGKARQGKAIIIFKCKKAKNRPSKAVFHNMVVNYRFKPR